MSHRIVIVIVISHRNVIVISHRNVIVIVTSRSNAADAANILNRFGLGARVRIRVVYIGLRCTAC